MAKITQQTAQRIIEEFCQGASSYELADKYDLWQTSICNLISGRTWANCVRPKKIHEIIEERHKKGLFEKGRKCHIDVPLLTEVQSEIIVGSLLGDGTIKTGSSNCSFSKKQCAKYRNYIDWHHKVLNPYSSRIAEFHSTERLVGDKGIIVERRKVERYLAGYSFWTHQHPVFTDLRHKWYPEGKKIVPPDIKLTPLTIAIWFCDDGNNSFSHREAKIATQSFTKKEGEHLCDLLHDFGIRPKIDIKVSPKTGTKQPILKMNSTSYDNLIDLIKPHVPWDCMSHKIEWRPAKKQWEYSGKFTLEEIAEVKELRKVKSAKEIAQLFGVHVNTIYAIVSGRSWANVEQCH
jgi:hypothetical protein